MLGKKLVEFIIQFSTIMIQLLFSFLVAKDSNIKFLVFILSAPTFHQTSEKERKGKHKIILITTIIKYGISSVSKCSQDCLLSIMHFQRQCLLDPNGKKQKIHSLNSVLGKQKY